MRCGPCSRNTRPVRRLGEAFNAAWHSLIASGYADAADVNPESAREVIALRIIERAQAGERDITRLHDDALTYLANEQNQKKA